MGMDVFIDGELTVPAAKLPEAMKLLLAAAAAKGNADTYDEAEVGDDVVKLAEALLERIGVERGDNGDMVFGLEDSCRHEENDQWVIEALAPVMENGEFYMSGDDYRWKWVVEDGEFSEVSGATVYDHDEALGPTVEKIVALVYPADRGGLPFFSNDRSDYEDVLSKIENLLRETGYGPQAGKNELERLAAI